MAALGKDFELREKISSLRAKLLAKFHQQNRIDPEKLFAQDADNKLEFEEICKLYETEDEPHEIAQRVLREWDKNGDESLCVAEVRNAASVTDGKISLSSLDPGAPTSDLPAPFLTMIDGENDDC
eukprot:Skav206996  [mRNA]  locus=scaffold3805:96731:107055:+ [translate_table: standard]